MSDVGHAVMMQRRHSRPDDRVKAGWCWTSADLHNSHRLSVDRIASGPSSAVLATACAGRCDLTPKRPDIQSTRAAAVAVTSHGEPSITDTSCGNVDSALRCPRLHTMEWP